LAIKYLGSKRVRGTDAERTATNLTGGNYAGWKELGRTKLSSAGDVIDVGSLPNKRYYMVLRNMIGGDGNMCVYNRLNGDTGSNYALRASENGATDSATSSGQNMVLYDTGGDANDKFDITYISNLAGNEKLAIGHGINRRSTGSGNAPVRGEFTWKWANTSNAITTINTLNDTNNQSGNFNTDSEVVVLGYDPTDTNTTDFWTEITPEGGVKLSSAGDTLTTGTIASYKYLWLQAYVENSSNVAYNVRFNGVAGSDYAERYNVNGGSDPSPITSSDSIFGMLTSGGSSSVGHPIFLNMFIVNIAGKEKLVIGHSVGGSTGASNVPNRMEIAGKWANTNAITQIDIVNDVSGGDFTTSSVLKVWGSN